MLSKERGKYFQELYDELQYRFANYELNKKCEQLEKENQQLKKQKDDVIEYLNSIVFEGSFTFIREGDKVKYEILRMLGEIDDN